jgi:OmpA-OmpF porin, OOP family
MKLHHHFEQKATVLRHFRAKFCPTCHPAFAGKVLLGLCITFLYSTIALAQTPKPPVNGENIVPNPGFERFSGPPIGWSYKGAFFAQVVKYWFSATTASPDIYGQGISVPPDWAEKGFGKQPPHGGKSHAGLTLYGCINGKPHCREYVEIQLAEPLVEGQFYEVSFWTIPLNKSMYINKLGVYFSVNPIERKTDEILVRKAQYEAPKVLKPAKKGQWIQVKGRFKATYEAEFLLIGNFNDDENTQYEVVGTDNFNYAYYYIDDVVVKKVPPFREVPVKPDDLTKIPLEKGKTITLKHIYFAYDQDELLPRSYVELAKLLKIMQEHPNMTIEIAGHTDSDGTDDYNQQLSAHRAAAVVRYLRANGIATKRLKSKGEGEKKPVATNDTDEGKAKNRRVEFLITNF